MNNIKKYRRRFGRTGLELSPLGLGTVKFGRNEGVKYPEAFSIPSEEQFASFLEEAYRLGLNTLDTAPAYGESEARLGRIFKSAPPSKPGIRRENWVIVGKAGEYFENGHSRFDFSADSVEKSLHETLRRLDSDYLDILLLHSDGRDTAILSDKTLIRRLDDMKSQNLIKAHGASTKTVEGGILALSLLDCAMVTYHPTYTQEKEVIRKAEEAGKALLLKKSLASGHLNRLNRVTHSKRRTAQTLPPPAPDQKNIRPSCYPEGGCEDAKSSKNIEAQQADPVADSLAFGLASPAVSSIIVGTINKDHLRENVQKCAQAIDKK